MLVISQVPPPFHGSTLMTVVFLETLEKIGLSSVLVDRRFSKTLGAVGRFQASKVLAAGGLTARLALKLVSRRPEICVFFMTNRPASFVVDWVLSELLRAFKIPVIGYIHTQGYTALARRGRLWAFLVRRLLTSAQTIVCLSRTLESDVRDLAPRATVLSIPNTPHNVPDVISARSGDVSVLFLSNFITDKGIDEFVQIAKELAVKHPEVRFLAAGAPTSPHQLDELRRTASENLEVVGAVDGTRKWELMTQASVLVFPSRYEFEAQPLVIIEAAAAAVPVVAYDIGGIRDLVGDGSTGLLHRVEDKSGFLASVSALLDSGDLRSSMGEAARLAYETKYSSSAYERAWNGLLK